MGLRFRRSIKLAPGVRMNVSGSGVSWTLGGPGASLGIGKRGTFVNAGLAGSGIGSRTRLEGPAAPRASTQRAATVHGSKTAIVRIEDDGTVRMTDEEGRPLAEEWQRLAKEQGADAIRTFLQQACDRCNADVEAINDIHRTTPAPVSALHYTPGRFVEPAPTLPTPRRPQWWLRWLGSHVASVDASNNAAREAFELALATWQANKESYEAKEEGRRKFIEDDLPVSPAAREQWLDEQLSAIVWPRETLVRYELDPTGREALLDVDLPEIEDMPARTARPAERGTKVVFKALGIRAIEQNYARHVHGLAMRLIGELFASLPMLEHVTLSAYTQRTERSTGHPSDHYVLSIRVARPQWTRLNFAQLDQIDPVAAIAMFEHRRDMTANGKLRPIEPFSGVAA